MKRYQIITYSYDIGADEKMDYNTIAEAITAVKEYLKDQDSAFIYDRVQKAVRHAFNAYPSHSLFSNYVSFTNCKCHYGSKTYLYH